jgi:ribosomal protein S18 acetylase RimI-like enzyme
MRIEALPGSLAADAIALWHDAGLTRPWNDADADLRRAIDGPASTVLAALDDGDALLGTAMVGHDGHRGWVYYLAVRPEAQRRGIGRALMEACEGWVHGCGVPKIQLMVRSANAGVVAFYEQLGYEASDVVVLGKFLGPSPGR